MTAFPLGAFVRIILGPYAGQTGIVRGTETDERGVTVVTVQLTSTGERRRIWWTHLEVEKRTSERGR